MPHEGGAQFLYQVLQSNSIPVLQLATDTTARYWEARGGWGEGVVKMILYGHTEYSTL